MTAPALPCLSFESPVGRLTLVARGEALAAVLWPQDAARPRRVVLAALQESPAHPTLQRARAQLQAYFEGGRDGFDVPLDFAGTPFQQRVWRALLAIPHGQTRTYAQIAQAVGAAGAVRAVGAANGRNPISIIAPCHRVIGSNGTLTGFAGGLEAKAWLLRHEGALAP